MRIAFAAIALALALIIMMPVLALALGADWTSVQQAIGDPEVLWATATSVGCAIATVIVGVIFGVPAGYLLSRSGTRGRRFWNAIVDLPIVIPHPIVGIGLLLIFGRRRLVGSALRDGLGIEVVSAVPGVIICMLVVSAPFIIKAARDAFRGIPAPLERAARSLGASEARVFFTVLLPLAWRQIRSGALLAWARSISEFGSIVILAYYPRTAPVLIWDRFSAYGLRAAIPPALVLLVVCLSIFVILQIADGKHTTLQEIER